MATGHVCPTVVSTRGSPRTDAILALFFFLPIHQKKGAAQSMKGLPPGQLHVMGQETAGGGPSAPRRAAGASPRWGSTALKQNSLLGPVSPQHFMHKTALVLGLACCRLSRTPMPSSLGCEHLRKMLEFINPRFPGLDTAYDSLDTREVCKASSFTTQLSSTRMVCLFMIHNSDSPRGQKSRLIRTRPHNSDLVSERISSTF